MKTKHIFFLFVGLLYVLPSFSFAGVVINEIMYDVQGTDSGREWVEIYNPDSGSVDVSGYKFLENVDAANHGLSVVSGNASIPGGGFAIIVSDSTKFLTDWPQFSGTILKASFGSLSNTGGTLVVKNGTTIVDQVAYTSALGAGGTGNSLQRLSDGSFIPALPTLGSINATVAAMESAGGSSNTDSNSSTTATTTNSIATSTNTTNTTTPVVNNDTSTPLSAHSVTEEITYIRNVSAPKADAGRERLTTTHTPVEFEAKDSGIDNWLGDTHYDWAFGDGSSASGKMVHHTYLFPGDYVVVLNVNGNNSRAVSRTEVKVIDEDVHIASVQRGTGGYVELRNNSPYEVNIEEWKLKSNYNELIFPKDTIIKEGASVKFPFDLVEGDDVFLVYANNLIADKIGDELSVTLADTAYTEPTPEQIELAKEKVAKYFAAEHVNMLENTYKATSTEPKFEKTIPQAEVKNGDASSTASDQALSVIDNLEEINKNNDSSFLATPYKFLHYFTDFFTK